MDIDHIEFRAVASATPYFILGTILGVPAWTSICVICVRPELFMSWSPALLFGVLSVTACFVWLRAFLVRITNGAISYRTLFGSVEVNLSQVSEAKRVLEFNPWSNWLKPRNRLDLYVNNEAVPRISINLKILNRHDVLFLFDVFGLAKRKSKQTPPKTHRRN